MKSILLILTIFCSIQIHAQIQIYPQKGDYVKNPGLSSLAGTWQGVKDEDTFTIVLSYVEKKEVSPIFVDGIIGWHNYVENGEIESTTITNICDYKECSLTSFDFKPADLYRGVSIVFMDHNRSKNIVTALFKLAPGKTDEATWEVLPGDWSEGMYQSHLGGVQRPIPPPSKIAAIKEWKMKKIY